MLKFQIFILFFLIDHILHLVKKTFKVCFKCVLEKCIHYVHVRVHVY